MQKAHFRLTCEVLQKSTEGSLVRRVVIYKQLERKRQRERDYFIGDFKHYLPLTGTIFGSKRKTALNAQ